jgi:hypothetical protein
MSTLLTPDHLMRMEDMNRAIVDIEVDAALYGEIAAATDGAPNCMAMFRAAAASACPGCRPSVRIGTRDLVTR